MTDYNLSWITPQLAVSRAPMSYAELDFIRSQGIHAIVNLCAEFSDLHELERGAGFEVFYLPVWDDEAPGIEELETGLAWLDEAIYLGKKVLVHCRHGIGRTGTLVTSYLIRKGIDIKAAGKKLKPNHTAPTSMSQRKLLKLYGKNTSKLTIREPSLENYSAVDLTPYVNEYEQLIRTVMDQVKDSLKEWANRFESGKTDSDCCFEPFEIQLIEAICLNRKMNTALSSASRTSVIEQAGKIYKNQTHKSFLYQCPLYQDKKCLLNEFRPLRCQTYGGCPEIIQQQAIDVRLKHLSKNVFLALSGRFYEQTNLTFSIAKTLSGKYVQEYFEGLAGLTKRQGG